MNGNPMHFNEADAAETESRCPVDRTYISALGVRMSIIDASANAIANLGYDNISHHTPIFHGDTIFAECEVGTKRELVL